MVYNHQLHARYQPHWTWPQLINFVVYVIPVPVYYTVHRYQFSKSCFLKAITLFMHVTWSLHLIVYCVMFYLNNGYLWLIIDLICTYSCEILHCIQNLLCKIIFEKFVTKSARTGIPTAHSVLASGCVLTVTIVIYSRYHTGPGTYFNAVIVDKYSFYFAEQIFKFFFSFRTLAYRSWERTQWTQDIVARNRAGLVAYWARWRKFTRDVHHLLLLPLAHQTRAHQDKSRFMVRYSAHSVGEYVQHRTLVMISCHM
jgi:hypothetical protein